MRPGFWRVVVVAAICWMPGCGGNDNVSGPDGQPASCPGPPGWSVWMTPPRPLAVGETAKVDVVPFALSTTAAYCSGQVRSVEYTTSVPGIVSFSPGSIPGQANLKAETPGETVLGARITFRNGNQLEAAGVNLPEVVQVVRSTTAR